MTAHHLSDERIGQVLGGRYRLVGVISEGVSGAEYLAEDAQLRRQVSVRVLPPGLASDAGFLRRFQTEARAAAALSFENLVRVFDWGAGDADDPSSPPFVVAEFLPGGSLRAMLDGGYRLTPSQVLMVGLGASRGLAHAHRRGFVHRGITPETLLFDAEGRVRVAEFGLARALAEASWTVPEGASIGAARYAAPETLTGRRLDAHADVYSLALVLIEAATGSVPGVGDTAAATLEARAAGDLRVDPALGALCSVLEHATRLDPEDRPDADALEIALLAASESLPRPEPLPLIPPVVTAIGAATEVVPLEAPVPVPPPAPEVLPDPEPVVEATRRSRRTSVEPVPVRRRTMRILAAVILMALLAAGVFAGWYFLVRVPTFEVPSVVGLDREEAADRLDGHSWRIDESELTRRDDTKPGQVLEQSPAPGTVLGEGATVRLTISLGPTLVAPPQVVGLAADEAVAALTGLGLTVERSTANDEGVESGKVIKLDARLDAEQRLPKGSTVSVVVSEGPAPRRVPNVVGASRDAAGAALNALQLGFPVSEEFNETVPAGVVISQGLPEGQMVPRGTEVRLVVSKGQAPIPVPNVAGASGVDATATLQNAGFTVSGIEGPPTGVVLATDPPAGEAHPRGTAIRIFTRG